MLGALCARPKPWILTSLAAHSHAFSSPSHHLRPVQTPIHFADFNHRRHHHHSTSCPLVGGASTSAAASIWHVIQPSGCRRSRSRVWRLAEARGEGSWNVAWDARPARWLHRPDSGWLLFGVCACLAAPVDTSAVVADVKAVDVKTDGAGGDYKVTGVPADGRCLFRAIAHGACLRNGEKAPDEDRQKELADELRTQVVNELLKRRKEIEWIIEEDFDTYIKRIEQPYVWGGEPELLMACHVLRTMITVFMVDRKSGNLVKIANYGEEYQEDKVNPINVLFHGYGHYDILESFSDPSYQKASI